jgi:hypothetical protein
VLINIFRHEDLYEKMPNMATTKGFPKTSTEVKTWLGSAQIVLATLSMITTPLLMQLEFHQFAPAHNVIIDEGRYGLLIKALLTRFLKHLRSKSATYSLLFITLDQE